MTLIDQVRAGKQSFFREIGLSARRKVADVEVRNHEELAMADIEEDATTNHIELTVDIVSAYVSNNRASVADLPSLIANVHAAVSGLSQTAAPSEPEVKATTAQIRKSITPDALISFEDGKPYKTLRRHLATRGLTPESYREKWGLPRDYPMVTTSYSEARSSLAKSLGLGLQRSKPVSTAAATAAKLSEPAPSVAVSKGRDVRKEAKKTPAKPGRRRKAAEPAAAE
ncbi:putative transcriptional regulator [Methylobacterium sp. BE186]|uniref:MucR family transcriptional regulator n=1 Tax=Methylobacterium sp. BE186 TaxID=2817715 RepID=UPI0028621ACA|nr:MucR family transcriptional regulator [Methylobacterium sp. BE186]MDR7039623.1 putative transcriptional regulator [Methylobacterium sp. BE186]